MNDGSTDLSVTEQEIIHVLFLKEGRPTLKYLSIKSVKTADTSGIVQSISDAFQRIGNKSFTNNWWELMSIEQVSTVALKDAFKTAAFEDTDTKLRKLYL